MDEFKVTLSADVRKLKQGFKDATVMSKDFTRQMEKTRQFSEDAFGNVVEIKKFSGEIARQNKLYAEQQRILNSISKFNYNKPAISKIGSNVSLAEGNNYSGRVGVFKNINAEMKEMNNVSKTVSPNMGKVGGEIDKSFTKGLKSIKRLTIGFLGARSAFMLFRKYLSEYQSQNEEFAQKMQLTTSVITNALAPAFEFFGNVIQYAVIGLARIIELLTGVNILGKAVDNSLKGASKSAKELNDNLSGLDEISNIQEDSGGLSTGIGSQLNALAEFQKKIAEVDAWFKKYKIDEKIIAIRDALSDLWGWVEDHPFLTGAFVVGLITFKDVIIPALVAKIAGTGGGALSLLGAFKALIAVGVAAWVLDTDKALNDSMNTTYEETVKVQGLADEWIDALKQKNLYYGETEDYSDYDDVVGKTKDIINQLTEQRNKLSKELNPLTWIFEPARYYDIKDQISDIDKQISDIKEEQNKITIGWETTNDKIGGAVKLTETVEDNLKKANDKAKLLKDNTKIDLKINTTNADNEMNAWIKKWKNFDIGVSSQGTIKLPSYDVGTNYVPRDQIAMVHEGEAIIPKKYNNADYLGQLGNSETNMLLMELNRSILEFANRPQTLNVNGKELAKVTYSDYQEEGSRRGANTSIRRV